MRQLQYVIAVADALSFRRAAERCHVSQPSLSAQLAAFEHVVGVQVFERDRRRVLVTSAGKAIIDRARRILVDADDLVDAAARGADPLAGTLRIGVIPTVSPYLLPGLTPLLRTRWKNLLVAWTEDKTGALVAELEAGTLDAAVVALEAELGELDHAVIAIDPFVLVTPPGHPLAQGANAAPRAELRGEHVLLLDEGHCFREQALALCRSSRAHEHAFRATSLSTLVQMVAGGAGVTLLPALAVPTELRRAKLSVRPFREPVPRRTLALVWRKRSPLGAAFEQLADAFRAAYPEPGARRKGFTAGTTRSNKSA